jgi:hypothetical protein
MYLSFYVYAVYSIYSKDLTYPLFITTYKLNDINYIMQSNTLEDSFT